MTEAVSLQVVLPFHPSIAADEAELEAACERCYLPLLKAIGERPRARVAVHFGGHLLDHMARRHEDVLLDLKKMVGRGQVEVLGGLFYGGLPALLPENDVRGQVEMLAEFWESYLGAAPVGFWLPALGWSAEVPRLLADSGLAYGFVGGGQVDVEPAVADRHRGLGVIERGDARVAAFVIDDRLSAPLPRVGVDEWIEALLDRSGGPPRPGRVITVTIAAESLGLAPGSQAWCFDDGWLARWLDAASGGRPEVRCVLPAEAYEAARPAVRFALRPGCAPSIGALGAGAGPVDWSDFQRHAIEADTLYRRMLQVSEKLRDAIGTMEDEELEDDWSDSLATAQRLVFAAQASDGYWRGPTGGFTDPAVRDAVMRRLSSAANLIDQLVQGEDDWIGEEEEDRDGDLVDEVLVSTARLNAWLVPAHGAAVRSLESRAGERNVLDAGTRRAAAPLPGASPSGARARDESIEEPTLPVARRSAVAAPPRPAAARQSADRRGIVTHVFEVGTSPPELDSGSAVPLAALESGWELVENAIDEQGDCSYAMTVTTTVSLAGISPRTLTLHKRVRVPIDANELEISYTATLEGAPEVLLVTEIPLRLGAGLEVVEAGGTPADPGATELFDVDVVRLRGGDEVIEVRCSRASDFWCLPVGNELFTADGPRSVDDGLVLVHPMLVEGSASFTLTLVLSSGTGAGMGKDSDAPDDDDGSSSDVFAPGNEAPTMVLGDSSGEMAAFDGEDDGSQTDDDETSPD